MSGLISVIIPVYNGEEHLSETIDAVLNSDYKEIELLLIDDGSTDSSSDICREYSWNDSRVRYIRQKNGGIVAARNRGLEEATGEYICFCDQDDITAKNMYSCMLKKIKEDSSELCMCGTAKFYGDSEEIYEAFEDQCYCGDQIRNKLLVSLLYANMMDEKDRIRIHASIWKCMISKAIIDKYRLRLRRFINYEDDWILLIELLSYCSVVSTVSITGYFWRTNLASESHAAKYVENMEKKQIELLNYMRPILTESIGVDAYKKFCCAKTCLDIIKIFENEGSQANRKSGREKSKYLKNVIGRRYTPQVEKQSRSFAKGCVRYKVIYFFVRRNSYMGAYYANKLLQSVIYLLHKMRIGNKIERLMKG